MVRPVTGVGSGVVVPAVNAAVVSDMLAADLAVWVDARGEDSRRELVGVQVLVHEISVGR